MRLDIVESLRILRFTVAEQDGIAADIIFTGRSFPIQEPRFTRRIGTRRFQDVTRMTQNGRWPGWISIDGHRIDLSDLAMGTRDR